MFDIPTTSEESALMVQLATSVCGRCGVPVLTPVESTRWNLAAHVCDGDYGWLADPMALRKEPPCRF